MTVKEIQAQEAITYFGGNVKEQSLHLKNLSSNEKIIGKADLATFLSTTTEKLQINGDVFSYLDTSKCGSFPIRELVINDEEKDVNLKDFPNLVKLRMTGYGAVTSLDLTVNTKLEEIELNGEVARNLDLKIFSHLTNLKKLKLGYANGSFKSLKTCTNLEHLHIEDKYHGVIPKDGIEYLNLDKLKHLYLGLELLPYNERSNSGYTGKSRYSDPAIDPVKAALEPYNWDIKAWKLVNYPHLINSDKKVVIQELDKRIAEVENVTLGLSYKNKLEILQDFRTQKLKEVVFP